MRWMIASDIHGSAKYCRLMLDYFAESRADRMILLGDILYHGPRNALPEEYNPKEVARMLNEIKSKLLCVRGNCDAEVDQMVLEFPVLADYAILPVGKQLIYFTHGHHENEDHPFPMEPGDYMLCGHTHIPGIHRHETFTYMNPGSVSLPKNGSRHSCMLFEDGKFSWIDLLTKEIWLEECAGA